MPRRTALGFLTGAGALLLGGCDIFRSQHTYHYRITVEVQTPEGVRTGAAVRQVRWRGGTQITPEADTYFMAHKGEAAVIALPDGQYLFALPSPDGQETPMLAFGDAALKPPYDRSVKLLLPSGKEAVYGKSGYPRLVRFRDLSDPKSIEAVDPENLAASFGPGYRLNSVAAQITDEPLTSEVRDVLPWIDQYYAKQFSGSRFRSLDDFEKNGLSALVSAGAFIQGKQ